MGLVDFKLGDIGNVLTSAREAITGKKIVDPTALAKIDLQLQTLENALTSGQLKVNEAEAKSGSLFIAGWRPMVGWICALALAYQFLLYPLIVWAWVAYGNNLDTAPPMIDGSALYPVLLGMLGIGGMRSFDKLRNTDTKVVGK